MNNDDNKHCTETKYSCRYHYHYETVSGCTYACGVQDDPTRIELRPKSSNWPQLAFEMPRQKYELEQVERLMHSAYERGQADKMKEIANLFKTVIGL